MFPSSEMQHLPQRKHKSSLGMVSPTPLPYRRVMPSAARPKPITAVAGAVIPAAGISSKGNTRITPAIISTIPSNVFFFLAIYITNDLFRAVVIVPPHSLLYSVKKASPPVMPALTKEITAPSKPKPIIVVPDNVVKKASPALLHTLFMFIVLLIYAHR